MATTHGQFYPGATIPGGDRAWGGMEGFSRWDREGGRGGRKECSK